MSDTTRAIEGQSTIPTRRMRFILPGHPLMCPVGHRMKEDTIVLEHAGIRCKFKLQRHPRDSPVECGLFLYVLEMPSKFRLVAEVTLLELRHMQTMHMDVATTLAFLGATRMLVPVGDE